MSHQHAGHVHAHGVSESTDIRYLAAALGLISGFLIFEVCLAFLGSSLALFADAGHMLTDATALAAAIWVARLARTPPHGSWTFGLRRAEILSAQGNGIALLVMGALVAFDATQRLIHPPAVQGAYVLVAAAVGIAVNLVATWMLYRADRSSLNVEGAFQHVFTDLLAFIATLLAGVVILSTGFQRADAIASLIVVALMFRASFGLLKATGRILLEAGPEGTDVATLGRDLASQMYVAEVHDVHFWTITSGFPALAAHVLVDPDVDCHAVRRQLEGVLLERYGISHTTLQVDHLSQHEITPEELLATRPARQAGGSDLNLG